MTYALAIQIASNVCYCSRLCDLYLIARIYSMTRVNYWSHHEIISAVKLIGATDRDLLHITSIYGATKLVIRERNEELRAKPATTEGFGSIHVFIFCFWMIALLSYGNAFRIKGPLWLESCVFSQRGPAMQSFDVTFVAPSLTSCWTESCQRSWHMMTPNVVSGLILDLSPANERRRLEVTPSLIS